jgi:hypothetical protein
MAPVARDKLERLLDALARCRSEELPQREDHFQFLEPRARRLHSTPLVHVMKSPDYTAKALRSGELLSRAGLGLRPLAHEDVFGLGEPVYTSAGVVYPSRETALVIRAIAEDGTRVEASPWDSGAFYNNLCSDLEQGSDEHRERFATWTLPAPEYREYLVHYVASCFDSVKDYVQGRPHRFRDPLGVLNDRYWTSRVFEVRFQHIISINKLTLQAVFVPAWIKGSKRHEELVGDLQLLRSDGVEVIYYRSEKHLLQERVQNWLLIGIAG